MKVVELLSLRSIFFFILATIQVLVVDVYAGSLACNKSQNSGYVSIFENGRIQRQTLTKEQQFENEVKMGGLIEYGERAISAKDKEGLLELFRLYSYASKVEFKQDKNTDKITEILLGLPLTAGYSIDLQFGQFDRVIPSGAEGSAVHFDKLVLKEGFIVDPAGIRHKLFGSSILANNNGNARLETNQNIVGRLHDFAGLESYNFKAFFPAEISGSVLQKFNGLADKLTFLSKSDLATYAEKGRYYKIRWELFRHYVQNRTAHYLFSKGVFKQITKLVFGGAAVMAVLTSPFVFRKINPEAFDNTVKWVQQSTQLDNGSWVSYTLRQFSGKDGLSPAVKAQLQNLEAEFMVKLREQDVFCANTCKFPADLNANKTEMASNKYIWVETKIDPETKKSVTLVYVARVVESTGSAAFSAIPIDPQKYSLLIQYLENRGQFYFAPAARVQ